MRITLSTSFSLLLAASVASASTLEARAVDLSKCPPELSTAEGYSYVNLARGIIHSSGHYFYTTNPTLELGVGTSRLPTDAAEVLDASSPVFANTVFLYRYNTPNGDHYYTTATGTPAPTLTLHGRTYTLEGPQARIFDKLVCKAQPLVEFYNSAKGNHLYLVVPLTTLNLQEILEAGSQGYRRSRVVGYARVAAASPPPPPPPPPPSKIAVLHGPPTDI
ncbi:hypothetical protein HGRIS_000179 [Hohenbuehelia grisea]|uniref:DUF5648 domain-containing protein n=1 Tax=Hohenbuehelia grisea TaxID=104357 RepID=A0ABR3JQ98_9AGAR